VGKKSRSQKQTKGSQNAPVTNRRGSRREDRGHRKSKTGPGHEPGWLSRGNFWLALVGGLVTIIGGVIAYKMYVLQWSAQQPEIQIAECFTTRDLEGRSLLATFVVENFGGDTARKLRMQRSFIFSDRGGRLIMRREPECTEPECTTLGIDLAPKNIRTVRSALIGTPPTSPPASDMFDSYAEVTTGAAVWDVEHRFTYQNADGDRFCRREVHRYSFQQRQCVQIESGACE
jgi:hypothetical protein